MKKLFILFLALTMVVAFAACGGSESTDNSSNSSSASTSSGASSGGTSSAASNDESSAASSENSLVPEMSDDTSSEESEEEPLDYEVAETISQYVSWKDTIGAGLTGVKATDATSLPLTAINESPVDGTASVIAFNYDYGRSIESEDGSYDDYNVLVFSYDHSVYGYVLASSLGVEDENKDDVEIPEDGYVLAVHKHWQSKVDAMLETEAGTVFFPHGFRATDALDANIKSGTATIDGEVTEAEYGKPIWEIEPAFEYANYEQFDALEVDVTAKVYMTYDADYLYIGVVVDSPNHYLPNKDSLWRYDSIQVNVISIDPMSDAVTSSNYWDINANAQGSEDNVFRQYGYGVLDSGESVAVKYMGKKDASGGETKCIRDDGAQTTVYEASIPLSECGAEGETIVGEAGTVIGVSVSINQGDADTWKNVMLRDGGGIIGLNDITKVPTIKLS